ncbi:MAG TPA: iron ABC transporter permease [Synergistaceae bacterium]|nr:iron ABC transporter permease [Synergistaceae bacterium]
MHLEEGTVPAGYSKYIQAKVFMLLLGLVLLLVLAVFSISTGPVSYDPLEVLRTLFMDHVSRQLDVVVFNIRLPQVLAAILAGAGLSVAGVVMQSVLGNPLGSPFTLGISQAAAFGAAFSVMVLGSGFIQSSASDAITVVRPGMTTVSAFAAAMIATGVVVMIARIRRGSPEVMILAGVAIGSLCTAATMFLQYFADDVQLAAMVFWTFGDLSRAGWREIFIISCVSGLCLLYFAANSWNYNAIDAGDETAASLGINVKVVRFMGMTLASLVTAVIISFVGVIGFVGLVCPHMVRRLIGDDNRFLIPGSCIMGSILLLAADTAARVMMAPNVLPVAILTSFVGAPMFLFLLVRGYRK